MTYAELKQAFRELKHTSPRKDLTAHIIFTEDSFPSTVRAWSALTDIVDYSEI